MISLPKLNDHTQQQLYSSSYEHIVLLSCSSYSYSSIYCYYLPFAVLAWRRLGFEPVVLLVGSERIFRRLPLIDVLKNDLNISFHIINTDRSRSISTSQLVRLFGGFLSYSYASKNNSLIFIADVDLLPITRHRFDIDINNDNHIVIVNAYCCHEQQFSYQNDHNIDYYPMSYVGMTQYLWKQIFLPLGHCYPSSNLTVDFIECCLKSKYNQTIPKHVVKGTNQWDIDQKLLR
jgi:hypothetical protein